MDFIKYLLMRVGLMDMTTAGIVRPLQKMRDDLNKHGVRMVRERDALYAKATEKDIEADEARIVSEKLTALLG